MIWSKKDVDLLKELLGAGKSVSFCAAHFETSEDAIRMRMSRSGLAVRQRGSARPSTLGGTKRPEDSLALRLAILQGLTPAEGVKADIFFSDEQLKGWIGKPDLFILDLLGIELQPFQKEMFSLFEGSKRVAVCAGRGVGKSFSAAMWLIYFSVIRPNQKSLIVSPSDRQSKLIFSQIQKFLAQSKELFNSVALKKSNMDAIVFENESSIIPLPSSAYIRGFQNVSLVLMDECAFFADDEMIFSAIMPMLNVRSASGEYGSLILLSSPNGTNNKFFEFFHSEQFSTMKVPSRMNKFLDAQKIESDRDLMTSQQFESEYEAEFLESVSNFFSTDLIKRCTQSYVLLNNGVPEKTYHAGWDTASSGRDSSVIVVSELVDGVAKVVHILEMQKQNLLQQMAAFESLALRFKFSKVAIEKAGFGEALLNLLEEKGFPVMPIKATIDEKASVYSLLLKKMESSEVVIPSHPKLQSQLKMFRYELSRTGKLMLHHTTEAAGDDFCDALAFSVFAAKCVPLCFFNGFSLIQTKKPQLLGWR